MQIHIITALTLYLTLYLLVSCESSRSPQALRIHGNAVERAIQPCSLPLSASIIAYLSVGLDRYLMTPDVTGQSASITLTLTTGDIVSVEIVYVLDGDSHTIARAVGEVPAVGQLEFQDTDFDLVDNNMNSVPDCLELVPDGAASTERAQYQKAGFRFSRNTIESAITTRPVSTGSSTVAFNEIYVNTGSNASCALDTGPGSLWFWWLPITQHHGEFSDFSFVELDLKVLGFHGLKRLVYFFVVDGYGRSWSESLTVRPGIDWTRVVLPINTSLDSLPDNNTYLNPKLLSAEPESLEPGLYILGDYISGTGDGSCIALINFTG